MARKTHLPHRHAVTRSRVASPITCVVASCQELILVRPRTRHGSRVDTNDSHDTPPECRTLMDQNHLSPQGLNRLRFSELHCPYLGGVIIGSSLLVRLGNILQHNPGYPSEQSEPCSDTTLVVTPSIRNE
ncbi:hypothetical protein F2Q68_00024582 [Brassica cretica]|uniref:Uncharacterized protein n=1 Tax=Brassica cretica TaxID=69181 RepID=A0A8S9I989_BRACR|nr:hypothetical protein F2Q68_00024582 [Brassica cretica]